MNATDKSKAMARALISQVTVEMMKPDTRANTIPDGKSVALLLVWSLVWLATLVSAGAVR